MTKFSEYIQKQRDEFRKAGDGYDALSDTSKACIDYAVQRFVDEYAAKQQAIAYCEWYCSIGYLPKVKNKDDYKPGESYIKDQEQLYKEFLEQQNKDNESNPRSKL